MDTDILIVGAGPTGLAMGNLLGMFGIDAIILEQNAGLSDRPKAIAMDDEGLRVCQAMGLHHNVIEHLLYDIDAHYISGKYYLARVAPTSNSPTVNNDTSCFIGVDLLSLAGSF